MSNDHWDWECLLHKQFFMVWLKGFDKIRKVKCDVFAIIMCVWLEQDAHIFKGALLPYKLVWDRDSIWLSACEFFARLF